MSGTPMTPERLAEIAARAAHLYEYVQQPDEADVLAGTDVPALLAEVERLRAELDKAHDNLIGANLSLYEEERAYERLRVALESAKRGRRETRARVAELEAERHSTNEALSDAAEALRRQRDRITKLEARPAELAPLREAALHDLPTGTQWRVITTDSESLTGLAPVCTADRRFHEIADYPGGPKYDDEGVYDCCPWPQVETYSVAVAAYLVALLNADAAKGGDA
ncbi:hypothetical protein AB0K66_26980 [Streptomyces werraensis]|uniref:hypothetical protein n=1 Tax=Streptomyces werraensis TaxID=68284 RepID=UPI00341275B8